MTVSLEEQEPQSHMIGVPGHYFRSMASQDYANYRSALAREFLQNSADAKAKNVHFVLDKTERTLTVIDDGTGMDRETVINKLLVLGGSQKLSGSVGGFGKAKELLFFSWDKYEIHTRDLVIKGSGAHFTIQTTSNYVGGTQAKIWFPESEDLWWLEHNMSRQLASNQVDCIVTLNGNPVETLRRGKLVKELDYTPVNGTTQPFAKIHLNKSTTDERVHIRLRGMLMFCKELWSTRKGQIIIELQGESVDLLTSNRDGLKYDAQRALDEIINELLTNCNSALREKPITIDKYAGSGLVSVQSPAIKKHNEEVAKAVAQTQTHVANATNARELSDIIQNNNRIKHYFQQESERIQKITDVETLTKAKIEIQKALKAINYKPDFIVKRRDKLLKDLDPATWSKTNLKLAVMWETVLKQVIYLAGHELEFSIGWVLDDIENLSELYMLEDNTKSFLLNPKNANLMTRNFKFTVDELVDLAIREVTRLKQRSMNEAFFDEYQNLRRVCRGTDFSAIIREALKAF